MTFEYSAKHRLVTAYHYDANTGEYLTAGEEPVPAHTGLPANSTHQVPPAVQDGFTRVFRDEAWNQVEDHRGQTVYLKATRDALKVKELGALRDTVTLLAPGGDYDQWNASTGAWEEDTETRLADEAAAAATLLQEQATAAAAQKSSLMGEATLQIAIYGDAVEDDATSTFYRAMLAEWKRYRVLLNHVDTRAPASIAWPPAPDHEAIAVMIKQSAEKAASTTQSTETVKSDTIPPA